MATATADVEWAARRVADALHDYAATKGWDRKDYRIFIKANPDWGLFRVAFVARAYDGIEKKWADEKQSEEFRNIMRHLRAQLGDVQGLYPSIGLVLTGMEGYGFPASPRLLPGEVEIDDSFLNPGVEDFRRPFRRPASGTE